MEHLAMIDRAELVANAVDTLTKGIPVCIQAPYKMGKTTLALQIAEQLGIAGFKVTFISLANYLSSKELADVGSAADKPVVIVDDCDMFDSRMPDESRARLFAVLDTPGVTPMFLCVQWREVVRKLAAAGYSRSFPRLNMLLPPPITMSEMRTILQRQGTNASPDEVKARWAASGGNLRLLQNILAHLGPDARRDTAEPATGTVLKQPPTKNPSAESPNDFVPGHERDTAAVWKLLETNRVVQVRPNLQADVFVRSLAEYGAHLGRDTVVLPNEIVSLTSAYPALANELLDRGRVEEIEKAVEKRHRFIRGGVHNPDLWQYLDELQSEIERLAPWNVPKLAIVTLPLLPKAMEEPPLLEFVSAVARFAQLLSTGNAKLWLVIVSPEQALAETLTTYLLRQEPIPAFTTHTLQPSYGFEHDLSLLALRRLAGQNPEAFDWLHRHLGVQTTEQAPRGWSDSLRALRKHVLLDARLPRDVLSQLPASPDSRVNLDENWRTFIRNLGSEQGRPSPGLGTAFGTHWVRFGGERLAALLENGEAVVQAWANDVAALSIEPTEELMGHKVGPVDPFPRREAELRTCLGRNNNLARAHSLLASPNDVRDEWASVAERLTSAGLQDEWAKSVGYCYTPTADQIADYLYACEPRTPAEYRALWLGTESIAAASNAPNVGTLPTDDTGLATETIRAITADDPLSRASAFVREALGDELEAFLARHFPHGAGQARNRLEEWLLVQRWRDEIAMPLAEWLGVGRVIQLAKRNSVPYEGLDTPRVIGKILDGVRVPAYPRVDGIRSQVRNKLHALRQLPIAHGTPPELIRGHIVEVYQVCETACMNCILAWARVLPEYHRRLRTKLDGFGKKNVPLEEAVRDLELGRLTSLVATFVKRARKGGEWHDELQAISLEVSFDERIIAGLEKLRVLRPPMVHGQLDERSAEDERRVAVEIVGAFASLIEFGFDRLVPPLAQVIATATDGWGRHIDAVNEEGTVFRNYLVAVADDPIGKRFFIITNTNPNAVRPILVAPPAPKKVADRHA